MLAGSGAQKTAHPGADALLTRGRPHGRRREGEAVAEPAGSGTSGRHGNIVGGTREVLCPAVLIAAKAGFAWRDAVAVRSGV